MRPCCGGLLVHVVHPVAVARADEVRCGAACESGWWLVFTYIDVETEKDIYRDIQDRNVALGATATVSILVITVVT